MVSFQDARDEAMEDDEAMEVRSSLKSYGGTSLIKKLRIGAGRTFSIYGRYYCS